MTDTPNPPPSDPIASLYRMSATAGVGTQDYVAINNLAVVTCVLGLASSVAWLFNTVLLLVIPLAAIGFGIVSLRAIRGSNGTQGGVIPAFGGILLALLFCGAFGLRTWNEARVQREEQVRIEAVIADVQGRLQREEYAGIYDLFIPAFQRRWSEDQTRKPEPELGRTPFVELWRGTAAYYGRVQTFHSNSIYQFDFSGDESLVQRLLGTRRPVVASTQALIRCSNRATMDMRQVMVFRRDGADWRLERLEMFDRKRF